MDHVSIAPMHLWAARHAPQMGLMHAYRSAPFGLQHGTSTCTHTTWVGSTRVVGCTSAHAAPGKYAAPGCTQHQGSMLHQGSRLHQGARSTRAGGTSTWRLNMHAQHLQG